MNGLSPEKRGFYLLFLTNWRLDYICFAHLFTLIGEWRVFLRENKDIAPFSVRRGAVRVEMCGKLAQKRGTFGRKLPIWGEKFPVFQRKGRVARR